ncbi:hypothetical protein D3C74_395010 [compost metagenome]
MKVIEPICFYNRLPLFQLSSLYNRQTLQPTRVHYLYDLGTIHKMLLTCTNSQMFSPYTLRLDYKGSLVLPNVDLALTNHQTEFQSSLPYEENRLLA